MTGTAADLVLADTNICLYAFDADAPVKRPIARQLLAGLMRDHRLVLTAQILSIHLSTTRRKPRVVQRPGDTREF